MHTIEINFNNLDFWQEHIPNHVMALGFFDGLHKGHREVIKTAKEVAIAKQLPMSVMSFFPHPKSVLSNGKEQVDYLMPLDEKKRVLESLGVDFFFIVEFNLLFASLSPQRFVSDYLVNFGVVHAVCGFDYTYGYKGIGNTSRLREDSNFCIEVTEVQCVKFFGQKISSTAIRNSLNAGKLQEVQKLLGKPYEVKWHRYEGLLPQYTVPKPGVYFVTLESKCGSYSCNIKVLQNRELHITSNKLENCKLLTIRWHYKVEEESCMATS